MRLISWTGTGVPRVLYKLRGATSEVTTLRLDRNVHIISIVIIT